VRIGAYVYSFVLVCIAFPRICVLTLGRICQRDHGILKWTLAPCQITFLGNGAVQLLGYALRHLTGSTRGPPTSLYTGNHIQYHLGP